MAKSNLKTTQTNTFQRMVTDVAIELAESSTVRYMLNCNVLSTAEGNVGIVTNLKGNIVIEAILPDGENKTIGAKGDEENNKFYYAVWNSNGYHGWYMFDAVSKSITPVLTSIQDTGNDDIFGWKKTDSILHINIIANDLLSWSLKGSPARKFNILKALDKTESGYGDVVLEEYTRAYKRAPSLAPDVRYITDLEKKFNRVYGFLFKFAYRFIYDDGERSHWSDFSNIAIPYDENFKGAIGVPDTNNGMILSLLTGNNTVEKIEIAMQKTNPEGGIMDWVSVDVLDKATLSISSGSQYEYRFFNDVATISLDQESILKPYSFLPSNPECQEFTDNALIYANFSEGFPVVKVEMEAEVRYEDVYIGGEVENELNNPEIDYALIDHQWLPSSNLGGSGFRVTHGSITIGPDVKSGNIFKVTFSDGKKFFTYQVKANLGDKAITIASQLAAVFQTSIHMEDMVSYNRYEHAVKGWVGSPKTLTGNAAQFEFAIWNFRGEPYWGVQESVNRVNTSTLKDNGQSLNNIKLGSSRSYGIFYKDQDGKRTLTYPGEVVAIKTINELGGIKRPIISLSINHPAPSWARSYQIARTKDLVYSGYIQLLIQQVVVNTNSSNDTYADLVIGSLYAYQNIHPNSTLNYEFRKGDRVRLIATTSGTTPTIPSVVKEYEVIEYKVLDSEIINKDVTVDGTNTIKVDGPLSSHIGLNISIEGTERTIINVVTDGYLLDSAIATGNEQETRKYPAFELINRRGVVRIKMDTAFPITVDPQDNKFALVEIYRPSVNENVLSNENYYAFGYEFPVNSDEQGYYHAGNVQNQTLTQPAIVEITEGDNYVRNRALPTNTDKENPQFLISGIEDPSFSDFYVSDFSTDGRVNVLDTADGVVHMGSRARYSRNYIEGTRINGLSDFDNLDREDYNDKYGDIKRLLYDEGRLYVFKYLKYAWVPVYGNVIQDQAGTELIAKSSKLIPSKLQYFLWDGGVGNNPESVARDGNNVYSVSPNSGVICRLGGNGIIPISKTFGIDKEARDIISQASLSGAKMPGAFDRKNGNYVVSVEGYNEIMFNQKFFASDWQRDATPTFSQYELVIAPVNGQAFLLGDQMLYEPNQDFVGTDTFYYRAAGSDVIRRVIVNILEN